MEHHLHDSQPCWVLDTAEERTVVHEAAQAVQFAPEQRLDQTLKRTVRHLGERACCDTPLHLSAQEMRAVSASARFYLGTAHYDTLQRRATAAPAIIETAEQLKQVRIDT